MKKFFMTIVLLVAVMSANAQVITNVAWEDGQYWLYLDGCMRVPAAQYGSGINWQCGQTIQDNLARAQAAYQARVARQYGSYNYGYGVGGYPVVAGYPGVYGGKSSSFSVQTKNVGFDTYSSEFGGYKSSGTGLRVGDVNIRMSNSGYSNRTSTATPSYTRSATRSTSNVKNNAVSNASVRNTTATTTGKPIKATKEIRVSSLIPNGF